MTNDEIADKQKETLNNLKKFNENRKTEVVEGPSNFFEEDYTTGMVEDTEGNPTVVTQWTEELKTANEHSKLKLVRREETFVDDDLSEYKEIKVRPYTEEEEEADDVFPEQPYKPYSVTPICEFCGNFAYQGQLHGLGYCKEKVQYEQ